ncbi:unnamed protein product [Polarella glacialis]|uniref:Poly(ADP-ribose) glycohydrolase n=1 Tax=Polarella glacialis TaxID=89957 RepID=A0A813EQL2_POLGL|nr:unnamed protein product [Polarella glacialis]
MPLLGEVLNMERRYGIAICRDTPPSDSVSHLLSGEGEDEDEDGWGVEEGVQDEGALGGRRPVWLRFVFFGGAAALLSVSLLWLVLFEGGEHAAAGALPVCPPPTSLFGVAPEQPAAPSRFWLFCPNSGDCVWPGKPGSEKIFARWQRSPATLASALDSGLSELGGVPQDVWEPVRKRWLADPPTFWGRAVVLEDLAGFMRQTLQSDPFGAGDEVPYLDFRAGGEQPRAVVINHRQLAFLVTNALMGNGLQAVQTGLSAALQRCAKTGGFPDYLYSLLSLLAVLSRELVPGKDGSYLVAQTPRSSDESWRARLQDHRMTRPSLSSEGTPKSLPDFMAGGVPGQALTDIAGNDVGGGAQLCHVANSQDESLVIFYSEVLAFSFFVGHGQMLPVPFTVLGARRYLNWISGESSFGAPFFGRCGKVSGSNWLNEVFLEQEVQTEVASTSVAIKDSAFVAVASACSDCERGSCSEPDMVNNLCDAQRRHLDKDISLWYQAYEASMYHSSMEAAFRAVVRRIGTGPWGAGLWQGDSQQYFMAVWVASSLLNGVSLDYYLYDHFCENPGHQCFVLGGEPCRTCVLHSGLAETIVRSDRCGSTGASGIVELLLGRRAADVYGMLRDVGPPPVQVMDLIAGGI